MLIPLTFYNSCDTFKREFFSRFEPSTYSNQGEVLFLLQGMLVKNIKNSIIYKHKDLSMKIYITPGIGTGPTKLSAFDAALNNAGVANYNLIRLSSVVPADTTIIERKAPIPKKVMPGEWGDRLYVVMAEKRVDTPNAEAWAGIGWVQDKKSRKGLFVEHEGESEKAVRRDITQSLEALMATRNVDFGKISMQVVGRTSTTQPVCALVVAVYQASDWENHPNYLK